MPSLIKLLSDYNPRGGARTLNPYNFSKSKALQMQAGFKDTLIVGDDPESRHGMFMNRIITYAKVPQKNIVFFERLGYGGGWRRPINPGLPEIMSQKHEQLRKAAKVVHIPKQLPLKSFEDLPLVQRSSMLFVIAAGNMVSSQNTPRFDGDRDVYNSSHSTWQHEDPERNRFIKSRTKLFWRYVRPEKS